MAFALQFALHIIAGNIVRNKLGCTVTGKCKCKCNGLVYLVTYLLYSPNLSFTLSYVHCWGTTGAKLGDELGVKVGALEDMGAWFRAHLGDGCCLNGWKLATLSTLETVLGVLTVCPQAVDSTT